MTGKRTYCGIEVVEGALDDPRTDWDYRLVSTVLPDGKVRLAVHEVWFDAAGKPVDATEEPVSCEEQGAAAPELLVRLRAEVELLREALDKPILRLDEIVPAEPSP